MERRKKSKLSNPHQIAFYGKGSLGETALPNSLPPLSTLAQEMLMAGCDSKAHHTHLILNSKALDKVLHLAARYA
ncbi:hypothetical protein [Mesorhizobium sp. M0984]|uniref:hypothetical protein n=1 Tax=Mesorhizobium sp. M0984 TaxID=2957041 RepID=UPI003337A630